MCGVLLRVIGAAGFAFGIEQQRGLLRFPIFHHLLRLFRRQVSLVSGRVGIDRQPDHAFAGKFALQLLHVAAAVMLFHKRAFGIEPFQHHIFAFVFGKAVRFPGASGRLKSGAGAPTGGESAAKRVVATSELNARRSVFIFIVTRRFG